MKRRDFFKNFAGVAGAIAIAPVLFTSIQAQAEGRKRDSAAGSSDMVSSTEPTAKAVQYVETSKMKDKNCSNCVLFNKTETRNGKDVGTCALFPKKLVSGKAYCNSWAKKA